MAEFKREIFGIRHKSIFLHRKDIINKNGIFVILRNATVLQQFNAGLIEVVKTAEFKLACVIIDKKFHISNHINTVDPYHFCLIELLQQDRDWLRSANSVGDVVAESRNKKLDRLLQTEYECFRQQKLLLHDYVKVLTSRQIKFANKEDCLAGLELADMLAYPVRQRMLVEAGLIEDPGDNFGK